jgi:hypothetical protein
VRTTPPAFTLVLTEASLRQREAPDGASLGYSVADQNAAGLDAGLKLHEDPPFPRRLGLSEAPSLAYAARPFEILDSEAELEDRAIAARPI